MKSNRFWLCIFLLGATLCPISSMCQAWLESFSPQSNALAGVFVPSDTLRRVSLSYQTRYLLSETSTRSFQSVLPVGKGCVYLSYAHSGPRTFQRQNICASFMLRTGKSFRVGVSSSYTLLTTSSSQYLPLHAIGASAYASFDFSRRLTLSALFCRQADFVPQPYFVALSTAITSAPGLMVFFQAESDMDGHFTLRSSLEYNYYDFLFFRFGFSTAPIRSVFGLSFRWHSLSFDLSSEIHSSLGVSPSTSLTLWF